MKVKIPVALIIMCMVLFSFAAFAQSGMRTDIPISITVNDNYIKVDAKPFLYRDSTYIPIRFVSEALNAQVEWQEKSNTAMISFRGNKIELPVGKDYGYINGNYTPIRTGVKLVSDRTFVPVRFVSEAMGATVTWEQDYYNVKIALDGITVPSTLIEHRTYTNEDIYWLSRVISAESAGESMTGKIAVGNVVLNRVKSPDFPNTIYDVIFDGYQFEPTINGTIYYNPTQDSIVAALRCLEGENVAGNSLFFFNPRIASSNWISNNRPYNQSIGNHDFYL